MSQAFVLINCELGSEEKIIEELKILVTIVLLAAAVKLIIDSMGVLF